MALLGLNNFGYTAGGVARGIGQGIDSMQAIDNLRWQREQRQRQQEYEQELRGLTGQAGYAVADAAGNRLGMVPTPEAAAEYRSAPGGYAVSDTPVMDAGLMNQFAMKAMQQGKFSDAASAMAMGEHTVKQLEAARARNLSALESQLRAAISVNDYKGAASILNRYAPHKAGQTYDFIEGDPNKELVFGTLDAEGKPVNRQTFKTTDSATASQRFMAHVMGGVDPKNAKDYLKMAAEWDYEDKKLQNMATQNERYLAALRPDQAEVLDKEADRYARLGIQSGEVEDTPQAIAKAKREYIYGRRRIGQDEARADEATQKALEKLNADYEKTVGPLMPPPSGNASPEEKAAYQKQQATLSEMARVRGLSVPGMGDGRPLPAPSATNKPALRAGATDRNVSIRTSQAALETELAPARQARLEQQQRAAKEARLEEVTALLAAPQMSIAEGGLFKQAAAGKKYLGWVERKRLEQEQNELRRALGR